MTEEVGERAGDKEYYDDLNDEQRKRKVEGDVTLEEAIGDGMHGPEAISIGRGHSYYSLMMCSSSE